jgi:hypothetical protein
MALSKVESSNVCSKLLLVARAVGPAVNAAIRDKRETCEVALGAKTSYETFEDDDALVACGGDATADAMVAFFLFLRRCVLCDFFLSCYQTLNFGMTRLGSLSLDSSNLDPSTPFWTHSNSMFPPQNLNQTIFLPTNCADVPMNNEQRWTTKLAEQPHTRALFPTAPLIIY